MGEGGAKFNVASLASMSVMVNEVHLPDADSFVFQGRCCFDPTEEQG